ncbi:MAG: serine/threonine-protein kinase [Verrucomicrobiota bacterium]
MPDDPINLPAPSGPPQPPPGGELMPDADAAAETPVEYPEEQLLNTCPACGEVIDVSGIRPYEKIICPLCDEAIRVRTQFDHFTIQSEIGEGGMSRVFRAVDESLHRQVALKILHAEFFTNPEMTAQFEREAKMTASINHPNVVQVYKVGSDQSYFYIAMELLDSRSLEQRIDEQGAMPEKIALRLLHDAAKGLNAAAQAGLLHRDIKPGNILLDQAGAAKIVDFGLALVHGQDDDEMSQLWATPFYVPPEKLTGYPEDVRSDIYSLGSAFYHAMAGTPPYNAQTDSIDELIAIKAQRIDLRDENSRLNQATTQLINGMMAYDPNQRPQDYQSLLTLIDHVRQDVDPEYAGRSKRGTTFWISMIGGAAVLLLVGILTFLFIFGPDDDPVIISSGGGNKGGDKGKKGGEFVVTAAQTAIVNTLKEAREATQRGDLDLARTKFGEVTVSEHANDELKCWGYFHLGAIELLKGNAEESLDQFANCRAMIESVRKEDRPVLDQVSDRLADPDAVKISGLADADLGEFGSFAMLLYGLKNWALGDYEICDRFLNTYKTAEFPEGSWMANVQSEADQVLADINAFNKRPKFDPDADRNTLVAFQTRSREAAEAIKLTPELKSQVEQQIGLADAAITKLDQMAAEALAAKDQQLLTDAEAEAAPLLKELKIREAAKIWEDVAVSGDDARKRSVSTAEAYVSAAEFYEHFLSNLGSYRYDGEILRREGRPFSAKILRASPTELVVDLGFGPTNLKIEAISVDGLLQIAQKTAMRTNLTPELSQGAAFFTWICGDSTGAQALADDLDGVPGFDRKWTALTTAAFQ